MIRTIHHIRLCCMQREETVIALLDVLNLNMETL
jgi:hypothetical protein